MSVEIEYLSNHASEAQIAQHLSQCDADFVPPLNTRIDINDYANKIVRKAVRFEAWSDSVLIGFVAVYCNDHQARIGYITSVSILKAWTKKGIAAHLMEQYVMHVKSSGMHEISLEVASDNAPAIRLYEKNGFVAGRTNSSFVTMNRVL